VNSAKNAIISSMLGQPINVVLLMIGTIVTTRLLSPDERGVFSGVMAGFSLIQILQTFGTGVQLIRRSVTPDEIRQSATIALMGCLVAFIAMQFGAKPLSALLNEPRAELVFRVLSCSSLIAPLEVFLGGYLLRHMKGKEMMMCSVIKSFAMVGVSIGSILVGYTYLGLAIGFLAGTTAFVASAYFFIRNEISWPSLQKPDRGFLKRTSSLTGFLAAKNLSERLIHPAVLTTQGAFAAGILGTSWGILDIAKQILVDALMIFLTPLLSGHSNDSKSLRFYFEKMTAAIGGIVPPAFLSVAILSEELIFLLFGNKWIEAAPIMSIFCVAGALHFSTINYADFLIAQKKDSRALQLELVMTTICLGMFIPMLQYGLEHAAWTRVVYSTLVMCLSLYIASSTASVSMRDLFKIIVKNALVTAITVVPVIALHFVELSSNVRLCLATFAGLTFYVAALILSKHLLGHEIVKIGRRLITRASS
jgi:O-antigen/teichoic acid export membrane protein